MKLNLEFYQKEEEKPEEEVEQKIKNNIGNYEEVKKQDTDIDLMLALSGIRKNILNWYPFGQEDEILEIGAGYGEITGYLCEKVKQVTALELEKNKAQILAKRQEDKENLECIVGNLEQISLPQKFDYIIMLGQIEQASKWFPNSKKPEKEFLSSLSNMLKEKGKILLATDNKFGLQYWNGKKDLEQTLMYQNLAKDKTENGTKLWSEKTLKEMIEEAGFSHHKFYYVFPDYKMPNLIYDENYKISREDISRNFQYYAKEELLNFNENEVYGQLLKEGKDIFRFFANSFLVEIAKETIENNIQYITFSNYRKEKYRVMTMIKEGEVIKKEANQKAKQHIKNIMKTNELFHKKQAHIIEKNRGDELVSNYITQERFDLFLEKVKDEELLQNFKKYTDLLYQDTLTFESIKNEPELSEVLKKYDTSQLEKMKFTKLAYIDFIPKNCFLMDDEFYVFDQEWTKKYLPIEYIIYRAIENSNWIITRKSLLKKAYHIEENEALFKKLEEEFREETVDPVMLNEIFNRKTKNREEIITTMQHYRNLKEIAEAEKIKLQSELENKEQEIKQLQEELEGVYASRSWRITKPLRDCKNIIKK